MSSSNAPPKKQGRNELCHCGSNKKFKVCCANNVTNQTGSVIEKLKAPVDSRAKGYMTYLVGESEERAAQLYNVPPFLVKVNTIMPGGGKGKYRSMIKINHPGGESAIRFYDLQMDDYESAEASMEALLTTLMGKVAVKTGHQGFTKENFAEYLVKAKEMALGMQANGTIN